MKSAMWKRAAAVGMTLGMLITSFPTEAFAEEMIVEDDFYVVMEADTEEIPWESQEAALESDSLGLEASDEESDIFEDGFFIIEEEESESEDESADDFLSEETEAELDAAADIESSGTCGDNLTWTLDSEGLLTISGSGPMTDFSGSSSIPYSAANTLSVKIESGVTSIGNYAFYNFKNITDITIPDTVTSIGNYAFYGCVGLSEVTIPDTVATIGNYAFYGCTTLPEITIPDSVTSIGTYAFRGCTAITTVKLGSGLTTIGNYAFNSCSSLSEITIPDGVTSVGSYAFQNCTSLTKATLGSGVTSLGGSSFSNCSTLANLTIRGNASGYNSSCFSGTKITNIVLGADAANVKSFLVGTAGYFSSVESFTVEQGNADFASAGGVLFDAQIKTLIAYPKGKTDETYTVPETVETIGDYSFYGNTALTEITIPDSVTSIGAYAFQNCTALAAVNFGSGLTTIGNYAFNSCSSLTEITIPDSVATVGSYVFQRCTSLTKAVLGSGLTNMGSSSFGNCSALANLTIRGNASGYNSSCFSGTKITNIVLGAAAANVKNFLVGTSGYFSSVESFTVEQGNADFAAAGGVLFDAQIKTLIAYPKSKTDEAYTVPETVETIGDYSFYGNTALTEITIPDSVTSIGTYAFQNCTALATVNFGSGLTSIGNYAFNSCSSLTEITIPDSVATVGSYVFQRCTSLTKAVLGSGLTSIGSSSFNSCSALTDLTIRGNASSYAASVFNGAAIENVVLGPDAENVKNFLAGNNSYFSSLKNITVQQGNASYAAVDGVLFDAEVQTLLVYPKGRTEEEYTVPETVETIGDYCFYGNQVLTTITFPKNLAGIGTYAFYNCTALAAAELGDSLVSIGNYAFYNCTALTEITIPDSVTTVGSYAFQRCSSLTKAVLGSGLTSLGSSAFSSCSALTDLTIRGNASSYSASVFNGNKVANVVLGSDAANVKNLLVGNNSYFNSLQSITVEQGNADYASADGVLYDAELKTLIIYPKAKTDEEYTVPGTVETIGDYSFYGNQVLTAVTFPNSLTVISAYAFYNCTALTQITIPDSVTSIGTYAFYNCTGLTKAELGSSLTSIETYAFYNCSSLAEITIPDSVTTIGNYAFQRCTSLTKAVLGSGLTSLGSSAFNSCSALTELTILGDITSLGSNAFSGVSLSKLYIGKDVSNLENIYNLFTSVTEVVIDEENENYALDNGVLYDSAKTKLLKYPVTAAEESFTVPETVIEIANKAFQSNTVIKEVILPSQLQTIGEYAFSGCTALSEMSLPGSITKVGNYAFQNCTGMTKIIVGDGLSGFGSYCFSGCSNLSSLVLEGDNQGLSSSTFSGASFTTLQLGSEVSSIADAFTGISTLTSIEVDEENEVYSSQGGALLSKDGTVLYRYPMAKADESYSVPQTVTEIADNAFYNNQKLTAVTLPDNLTSIGNYAFYQCKALTSISIPDKTVSIGTYAFRYCSGLTTIELGTGLETIGSYAFGNCGTVDKVVLNSPDAVISTDTFSSTTVVLMVLGGDVSVIPDAVAGSTNIQKIEADENNDNFTTVDGVLFSKDMTVLHKYYGNGETTYTIPETVTKVGAYAFYNKSSLTSLSLPDTLQEIGNYAFYQCKGITGTVAMSEMHSIGNYAFYGCTGITSLDMTTGSIENPETGETEPGSIGNYAFSGCTSIEEMDLDGEAPSVDYTSFQNISAVVNYDSGYGDWYNFMDTLINTKLMMMEKGECDRAIALVVDVSGSMSGQAITALREAVSRFCEAVLPEGSKTKVVIISYASGRSAFGFTSNLELLKKRAEVLYASGGTNMSSALSLAESYLDAATAQEKDLIIMTDGLPNEGSTNSDGPFTSSDNSCYAYANAVCQMCEGYFSKYRVYSMGFFHSMSESEKQFASSFMQKVQNSGYYEVTQIDDLLAIFAHIAQEILSPLDIVITHTETTTVILNDPSADPYVDITLNAKVTNNNEATAAEVKAKIDLEWEVTVDGQQVTYTETDLEVLSEEEVTLGDIKPGETKTATWKLRAPVLLEDHEYQVGVVAGAYNTVATEAFHTMMIKAQGTSDRTINDTDKWTFTHGSVGTYYIRDDLYQYLLKCANGGQDYPETITAAASALENKYNTSRTGESTDGWGGSCFGMTTLAILYKLGQLSPQYWDNEHVEEDTSGLTADETRDLINYYHLLQQSSSANISTSRSQKSNGQMVDLLIEKLRDNDYGFVKVGISYGGTYNCDYDGKKKGDTYGCGHAILAYGSPVEEQHEFEGTVYDYYIPVYDINTLKTPERAYLSNIYYTRDKSQVMVPRYGTTTYGRNYIDYNRFNISDLADDWSGYRNFNPEKMYYVQDDVLTANARLNATVHTLEIYDAQGNHTSVKGLDAEGSLNVWVYYDEMELEDGPAISSNLNVVLDNPETAYMVSTDDGVPYKLSMQYDGAFSASETSKDSKILFDGDRGLGMEDNTGSYRLMFVTDEHFNSGLGNKITITGDGQDDLSIHRNNEGYEIISSNPLKDVDVHVEGGTDGKEIHLNTGEEKVLITNEENENVVKIDKDSNGTYETVVIGPGSTSETEKETVKETEKKQEQPKATEKITIAKKPTIKKPTAVKNKITVNWKHFKQGSKKTKAIWKQIKKVQIQCATDKAFSNVVKTVLVGKKKTKGTVKGLQKNTTYYVRVRYYDGTGYSAWTKAKRIKTKK